MGVFLLLSLLALPVFPSHAAEYFVSPQGSDAHTCAQARDRATPRRSLNGVLPCLRGGDTLTIATGVYDELLVTPDPMLPKHLTPIPPGTAQAWTVIRAAQGATVTLRPTEAFPGGGGVLTMFHAAPKYMRFEGINIDARQRHTQGVLLRGDHVVYTRAEIQGARGNGVASQQEAHHTLSYLHVHDNGSQSHGHGLYVCGTNKLIEHNRVHDNANYGIQVSCESGGIRDVIVRNNWVQDHPQRCMHIQGQRHDVYNNVCLNNGIGIGINGSDIEVAHNTIAGHTPLPDNWGIITRGSNIRLRNNLLLGQVGRAMGSTGSRYIYWGTSTKPTMQGNVCDVAGMGCQTTASTLVQDWRRGEVRLMAGSKAIGAGPLLPAYATDYAGTPRLTGDAGAFAYVPDVPPPPVTPPEPPPDEPPPAEPPPVDLPARTGVIWSLGTDLQLRLEGVMPPAVREWLQQHGGTLELPPTR